MNCSAAIQLCSRRCRRSRMKQQSSTTIYHTATSHTGSHSLVWQRQNQKAFVLLLHLHDLDHMWKSLTSSSVFWQMNVFELKARVVNKQVFSTVFVMVYLSLLSYVINCDIFMTRILTEFVFVILFRLKCKSGPKWFTCDLFPKVNVWKYPMLNQVKSFYTYI